MKRCISFSLLLALLFAPVAGAKQSGSPTAQQIADQMFSAYAACKSYLDTGEVRTVFVEGEGRKTVVLPFSTAFVRPSSFRFEFRSRRGEQEWERYIIWKQDEAVKSWWSIRPATISDRSFSMSVSGAASLSGKSALTVPSMLMPAELRANPIKALTNLRLTGEEKIGARDAYKIEGQDFRGNIVTVWIDKQRLLLLQIFEKRKLARPDGKGEFETEATTVYDPRINEDVPASKLAFDPPARGQ